MYYILYILQSNEEMLCQYRVSKFLLKSYSHNNNNNNTINLLLFPNFSWIMFLLLLF